MEKQTWFSTDYHLNQPNILKYDKREFRSIAEHDEHIINCHNKVVGENDDFFFLGDLAWIRNRKERDYIESLLWKMNGNKHFIKGNHDHKDTRTLYKTCGQYLEEQTRIRIGEYEVILNHFPMRTWNKSHHGTMHLYGHHHGDIENQPWGRSMDVCVTLNSYYPFNFEQQIKPKLLARDIMFIEGDHHKKGINK